MPVIFYNLEEQKSLEREPYKTLSKKFRNINYALDNCEIKLDIGSDDEGFSDGFYTDFNFTEPYTNAVNDGMIFIIKDEDSQIYKHGCVNFGCMSKPIKNLKPYFKNFTEKIYDRDKKFFS